MPEENNARRDLGIDVARAFSKARNAAAQINIEDGTAELRRRRLFKAIAVRWMKRLRNEVAEDENHVLPELVHRSVSDREWRRAAAG